MIEGVGCNFLFICYSFFVSLLFIYKGLIYHFVSNFLHFKEGNRFKTTFFSDVYEYFDKKEMH